MREYRVQEEFANVCKSLYEGVEMSVLFGWRMSLMVWNETGLSFVTSSLSVYVMEMLKDLEEKRLGIEVEGT